MSYEVIPDLVEGWLEDLTDKKARATILHILEVFQEYGPINGELPRSSTRFMFDGIWEIRVNQCRIGYFWDGPQCILLHGLVKKRNDWSRKDINLLKKRYSEYRSQKLRSNREAKNTKPKNLRRAS